MSSMVLALTGVIVANDTVDSTNGVIGCRKKNVQGYVVPFGVVD